MGLFYKAASVLKNLKAKFVFIFWEKGNEKKIQISFVDEQLMDTDAVPAIRKAYEERRDRLKVSTSAKESFATNTETQSDFFDF